MMKCHSQSVGVSERKSVPYQRDDFRKAEFLLVGKTRLQDILLMFLDLGLTPSEMSKTSGFPLAVIVMGLKQLDEVRPVPVCPTCGKDQFPEG